MKNLSSLVGKFLHATFRIKRKKTIIREAMAHLGQVIYARGFEFVKKFLF
jgi:hypothetical protein